MDASGILESLLNGPVVQLSALPRAHGVYALIDHTGVNRYIGKAVKTDFNNRINHRHTTGSEANSHKFSHTYSTGRMWRAKDDKAPAAKMVKEFRTIFIRHYCRARFVELDDRIENISHMEASVIALAPESAIDWNARRSHRCDEPVQLVDDLLLKLSANDKLCAAMAHQIALFQEL